jgi:coenzyme F420-0:L-glutamate ligase
MIVRPIKTRIFHEGDDIICFIEEHIPKIKNGSVLVVTSKIVALAEGRTALLKDKNEVVKRESELALKTKFVWLTINKGDVMADAGVDESNAQGKLILLPKDSFRAASLIRRELKKMYGVKDLGVILSDSRVAPLRAGVIGVALGYAGIKGLRDYRGKPDLFGRKFRYSKTNVADSLATAATVVMGEGRERQPLAVIEDAPAVFSNLTSVGEAQIPIEDDMYQPLFARVLKKPGRKRK